MQTVQRGITPDTKDLINMQEYDVFGRKSNIWLTGKVPVANNGAFVSIETAKDYIKASNGNDQKPYSAPVYEASPLNRILKQSGPGANWQDNGKSVENAYMTNLASDIRLNCKLYTVEGTNQSPVLTQATSYSNNQIYVIEAKDEDGNTSYEFKDKLGQVVLIRQMEGATSHDTYYVYNDFGNLCFVLPPRIQEEGILQAKLDELAYQYKYDHRNRCIAKKLPGCNWIYYVYDKADRLIFSQDGEQSNKTPKEWTFTIPDVFGRVVLSGICTNSLNYAANPLADVVIKAEYPQTGIGSCMGYNISGITLATGYKILSANYYDNYRHRSLVGFSDSSLGYESSSIDAIFLKRYGDDTQANEYKYKGLLTGTATAIFDNASTTNYLYNCMYYDDKSRLIQSKSTSHFTGSIEKEYIAYNFTGQPIARKHIHSATGKPTQTEEYAYTYDHAGRLLQTTHQLNGGATVTLLKNTYDELGRLLTTTANGQENLKSTYAYNIRSWTQGISNTHFVQTLGYTYGGNIHTQEWKQAGKTRKYSFDYDQLSRLTAANYTGDGQYGTGYTYDKHGNITTLQRSGNTGTSTYGLIDNLTLSYNGNQLIKVEDSAPSVSLTSSTDFVNGVNNATEYFYDLNGNMTKDLNKGISNITYNTLNLPSSLTISNAKGSATNSYVYAADGRKLSTTISGKKTDYAGNIIYENGNLKRILTENGYIEEGKYYFYITDHLGNNRIVADQSGNVIQSIQYYPFGMAFADGVGESKQPYKYNSKELDTEKGLNWYDYFARYMEPALGRFTTPDPLAETRPWESLYSFCGGNPLNRIDPNGMHWVQNKDGSIHWEKDAVSIETTPKGYTYLGETANGTDADGNYSYYAQDGRSYDSAPLPGVTVTALKPEYLKNAEAAAYLGIYRGHEAFLSHPVTQMTAGVLGSMITLPTMSAWTASRAVSPAVNVAAKTGTNVVYQGVDVANKVRYVGITGREVAVRFGEHAVSGTTRSTLQYEVIKGAEGLTRTQARIWEQTLINQYGLGKNGGQLFNSINSIAPKYWRQYGITP